MINNLTLISNIVFFFLVIKKKKKHEILILVDDEYTEWKNWYFKSKISWNL